MNFTPSATSVQLALALLAILNVKTSGFHYRPFRSPQCKGIATQCDKPNPRQIREYSRVLKAGGCSKDDSPEVRQAFAACLNAVQPELLKNISELTGNNQACRDDISDLGFKFQTEGILADCEVFGTKYEDCLVRCSTCIRLEPFGYDPTENTLKTFRACPKSVAAQYLNKT